MLVLLWAAKQAFANPDASGFSPGGTRDFVAYWSAARLLLTRNNPYSPPELLDLQRSVGMIEPTPLIMWNPPWTLFFVWPFGLLDFITSQFLWLVVNVFFVMFSAQRLLHLYGGAEDKPAPAWVLAFTFIPAVYSLILGQITPVILFGLTMFLILEEKKSRFGISLVLILLSIKPHFIYTFWLVVVLWLWCHRSWRILLGAGIIGFIASTLPLLFDPEIYSHYTAVHQSGDYLKPLDLAAPTLRNVLVRLFQLDNSFIAHLPTAAGFVWALIYWQRHRDTWIWKERLPLLLLVSIVTSPYSWTFDQIVLLPAIIQTYTWLRGQLGGVMLAYISFNILYLAGRYIVPVDFWYFWMAPLFLVLYLWFGNNYGKEHGSRVSEALH